MIGDIERIREALSFVPPNDRDTWLRMGMAIKSEVGDSGFDVWDAWSQQADSYKPATAQDVWKSIRANGKVTAGTLFYEAKANGWCDDGTFHYPTPEELTERKRITEERSRQEEVEITHNREETASKAAAIWKAASEANADNSYLSRKHNSPTLTLREIDAGKTAEILGYVPKSNGEPLAGRLLVAPIKVGDRLSTLELIDGNGRKTALAGRGTKAGGYWAAQPLPNAVETLLIGEGVATALSAKEATGHPAIAALSSANLLAVAKAMRKRYPAAAVVILADLAKASGEPDPHAIEAARSVDGLVAVPDFGTDRPDSATDFNDMAVLCGAEAVQRAITNASAPIKGERQPNAENVTSHDTVDQSTDDERLDRLAGLSPIEYDRVREGDAKTMGVRSSTLDKMVKDRRKEKTESEGIDFDVVEPWPHPVEASALLFSLTETVRRFIICPDETAHASALWVMMTWFMDVVQVAPLAVITAPEKRCGKSQLLFLLGRLVHRPLAASNISPAALFRAVDAWKPTLLVDEADAFMKDNDELRGLLNCGHTRDSAYIVRVVGDDHTPKRFNVWGAKALAGIGHLADTLMDRSIVLELRRKLPNEEVVRLRYAEPGLFDDLTAKLARFANDNRDILRRIRPDLPDALHDRAQDNWEPLLAIAEIAGGDWPELARHAALKLSSSGEDAGTVGNELLADIREIFETKSLPKVSSANLIRELCADDEKPWATYNRGKQISPRQVANRFREYGISSKNIRVGYEVVKGYEHEQFKEVFARYLASPQKNDSKRYTATEANNYGGISVAEDALRSTEENATATREPASILGCSGVADKGVGSPESSMVEVEI